MGNNEKSDGDIIKRVVDGEVQLFGKLVNKYKDRSLSLAYSIIKERAEAEDIIQEAFVKAFQGLKKFDSNSSFSTWFYRIVVNTSYNSLQRSKRKRTVNLDRANLDLTAKENSFNLVKSNERKAIVSKALDSLKVNESLMLRLYYLGEQSINEISIITGLSISNVKVLLHRSRKNFHAKLDKIVGSDKDDLL